MQVDVDRWQLTGSVLTFYWQLTGSLLAAYIARRCQPPNSWPAEQRMRPGGTQPFQRWQLDEIRQRCRKSTARAGYIAFREIFGKLSGSRSKPLETSQHALKRQGRHALRRQGRHALRRFHKLPRTCSQASTSPAMSCCQVLGVAGWDGRDGCRFCCGCGSRPRRW